MNTVLFYVLKTFPKCFFPKDITSELVETKENKEKRQFFIPTVCIGDA